MSILTRLTNRLRRPQSLERDFRDEIEFHIEMRANQLGDAGMNADDATKRARQRFGDMKAVMMAMRQARITSVTTLFTMTVFLAAVVVLWIAHQRIGITDLLMPALPAAPLVRDIDRPSGSPPPPPRPGPTWEEYVTQANAFKVLQQGPGTYSPRQADK